MEESSDKKLSIASFAIHASRGLIRDQVTRRKAMFVVLVAALIFLGVGSTFLQSVLNPREHPGWFILFWFICGWLTFTAVLLAVFDLLFIRAQRRKAERVLRVELTEEGPDSDRRAN
jgi:protein-S-isoprenylcysteine O-methyltransferase Ste14